MASEQTISKRDADGWLVDVTTGSDTLTLGPFDTEEARDACASHYEHLQTVVRVFGDA